jgi:hypothetical protein
MTLTNIDGSIEIYVGITEVKTRPAEACFTVGAYRMRSAALVANAMILAGNKPK